MKQNLLLLAAIFCMATSSTATIHTVSVADFAFTPSTIAGVHPGDTIMWMWSSGSHTTTSTTIPAGATSWDHNMTSSSTSFIYIPTVIGTYNYQCTPHASMGMVGSFTVVSASNVSQVNSANAIFNIFPNPASGSLHILFNESGISTSVTLTDITGKEVINGKYNTANETDLNLSDIPNGLYFISVVQGGKANREKLIVAH